MHFILIELDFSQKVVKMIFLFDLFSPLFFWFPMQLQLTLYLLNLVSLALCSTTNVSDESRKTSIRSASASVGSSAHLNSLQSSQDNGGKTQTVQQSNTGHTSFSRVPAAEYTSITQPHSPVYSQPTQPSGGYFISVNPQAALGPGITSKLLPVYQFTLSKRF